MPSCLPSDANRRDGMKGKSTLDPALDRDDVDGLRQSLRMIVIVVYSRFVDNLLLPSPIRNWLDLFLGFSTLTFDDFC